MSKSRVRTSADGYRLELSDSAPPGEITVNQRLRFIMACLRDNNQRILDIGCGSGAYLQPLSKFASEVVGVDIYEDYLKEARQNVQGKNIRLLLMSAEELAFKEGSFDAVILIETLEHISDDEKAIKEISKVLKVSGKLILIAPNKFFPFETHALRIASKQIYFPLTIPFLFFPLYPTRLRKVIANARTYSSSDICKMLTRNGFNVERKAFLMAPLDIAEKRIRFIPSAVWTLLRRTLNLLEKTWLKRFGTTIAICAEKPLLIPLKGTDTP